MARRSRTAAFVTILVLLAATGCAGSGAEQRRGAAGAASTAAPSRLAAADAFAAAVTEPGRFTVNVHVPFEGNIPGTDASVPFDSVEGAADELPPAGTPLAVYCRSGSMSAEAAPVLAKMGYDDIVELDGGMTAWVEDGRRILGQH